jgi:translation elongation factor EF-1alpha
MNTISRVLFKLVASAAFSIVTLAPVTLAQTAGGSSSSSKQQWIHVRVESTEDKGETLRVNVPVEMAEKVLPAINKDKLRNGKVHIDSAHLEDVDLRTVLEAVRTAKDGEYVTVQSKENDVSVAKSNGYLYIHVTDKSSEWKTSHRGETAKANASKESKVEVKVPMKVVDALFSAGKDELDVVAALRTLSANGDIELVRVKDSENTVRVWIDSKNVAD